MTGFEWSLPTNIVFGVGTFHNCAARFRGLGKRAFLITSAGFASNGSRHAILQDLLEDLKRLGIETLVFSNVEPNPRAQTIDHAAALARDFKPRFVIGLGGGSAMDAAKCVALLCKNNGSILDYAYKGPGIDFRKFNTTLPIVCIPTVAATGSEASLYAVVTADGERRQKLTIFNEALRPTVSIVDPKLCFTVSPQQTAESAVDIVTHCLETYLSSPEQYPLIDHLSEAIIQTVVQSTLKVITKPDDELARSQLSLSACIALCGLLNIRQGGWPIHALEHGISAVTDVSHGRGLAFLLPRILHFDVSALNNKLIQFNHKVFNTTSYNALESCELGIFKFLKDIHLWLNPCDVGLNSADLIQQSVNHAFAIDGIQKRTEAEPYLENILPIRKEQATTLISLTLE